MSKPIPQHLKCELSLDACSVEALQADHHQRRAAFLTVAPGAIEPMIDPGADRLNNEARRVAVKGDETFQPQDTVAADQCRDGLDQHAAIRNGVERDEEALEIVVVVLRDALDLVMRAAGGEIALGRGI